MPSVNISEWLKGVLDDKVDREGHKSMDSAIRSLAIEAGEPQYNASIQQQTRSVVMDPFDTSSCVVGRIGQVGSGVKTKQYADLHQLKGLYPDLTTIIIDPLGDFETVTEYANTQVVGEEVSINPFSIKSVEPQLPEEADPLSNKIKNVVAFLNYALLDAAPCELYIDDEDFYSHAVKKMYEENGIGPRVDSSADLTLTDFKYVVDKIAEGNSYAERMVEKAEDVAVQIEQFEANQDLGLFDAGDSGLSIKEQRVNYCDMQKVYSDPELAYCSTFIEVLEHAKNIEGKTVIVLPESQYLFDTDGFEGLVERVLRYVRHENIGLDFSTQTLSAVANADGHPQVTLRNVTGWELHRMKVKNVHSDVIGLNDEHKRFLRRAQSVATQPRCEVLQRVNSQDWKMATFEPEGARKKLVEDYLDS